MDCRVSAKKNGLCVEVAVSRDLTALPYCVFLHDVMAAIFVSQNNETAAMFVSQTSPVGAELFCYVNTFVCSKKFV